MCCSAPPTSSSGPTWGLPQFAPISRSLPATRSPGRGGPSRHRFETGTQSHEAVAGATAAIEYLARWGGGRLTAAFERIVEHEDALCARFLDGLPPGLELYGVRPWGAHADLLLQPPGHTRASWPSAWGPRPLRVGRDYYALGRCAPSAWTATGGAVRAGFLHYTTETEGIAGEALSSLATDLRWVGRMEEPLPMLISSGEPR